MKRREFIKGTSAVLAGSVAGSLDGQLAYAQRGRDTVVLVSEGGPNSFDVCAPGSNRSGYEVAWNCYDRLITWGTKTDAGGIESWDSTKFAPELAEEWDLRDTSVTFKLRKDATFHDGTPVTAKDVKWSFDRVVSIPGFPKSQMAVGSLLEPKQFVAVDDHTFRIDFARHDKITMSVIGVPVPVIINSELAKKHARPADPWAIEWLKNNVAGSGAFTTPPRQAGQEFIFTRNDKWKSGPLPNVRRVVWRVVPSASTRRALIERGDVDICVDLPPKDASEMMGHPALTVIGIPMTNSVNYIGMQVTMPPFDRPAVRQAIAHALPYQKIMDVALYQRARPLFGGSGKVTTPEWPQPGPYNTDLAKAKRLLTEAGLPNGFETTLSFDMGSAVVNEPMCVLIQESLAAIGIKVTLDKIAGSNWRAAFQSKKLPFITNLFGAWFNYPDFFFHWAFHGDRLLFNSASYQNPQMDKLIDAARFETDLAKYRQQVESFIQLAFDDLPMIPLFQPFHNVALNKRVTGFQYWFHRQFDYRPLKIS